MLRPRRSPNPALLALILLATSATVCAAQRAAATPADPGGAAARLEKTLESDADAGLQALLQASQARWRDIRSFRALFVRQERHRGDKQVGPVETIDYKFLKDHAVLMVWNGEVDRGKTGLFVQGRYGDNLCVKVRFLGWWHKELDPEDPLVMREANHPITESGFGRSLENIEKRVREAGDGFRASYLGRQEGPDKRACLVVRGDFAPGHGKLVHSTVWFDCESMMPVQVVNHDDRGLLERYEYRRLQLDPTIGGRPQLSASDFHRSKVFEKGPWRKEREDWTLAEISADAERLEELHDSPSR